MKEFISKHSVRLAALLAALIPLLVAQWPGIPWEALIPVVAAVVGLGEVAQRHQDDKTAAALFEVPPTD
jgi:phosphate/sulfate permease